MAVAAKAAEQLGRWRRDMGCGGPTRSRLGAASTAAGAGRKQRARRAAGPRIRYGRQVRAGVGRAGRRLRLAATWSTACRWTIGTTSGLPSMNPLERSCSAPVERTDDMILKFTSKGKFIKQFGGRDRHPWRSGQHRHHERASRDRGGRVSEDERGVLADGTGTGACSCSMRRRWRSSGCGAPSASSRLRRWGAASTRTRTA